MTSLAHRSFISVALYLLLFATTATVAILEAYHDAEVDCQTNCQERNLAVPLPRGELSWGNDPFLKCNYSCHVAACQTGCAGLRPPTEDCDQRCSTTGADDSCRQGCHAVLDSILRRIQVVLNTVQAASTFVQGQGLRVDWTFEQGFSPVIGQIAPNVSWYTQHRSLRRSSPSGWRWTAVGAQGFRGDPPRTTVFLPDVDDEEIEIRLAVSFKSHVLASSSSTQKIDAAASPPQKPVISASLQIRDDQYLICWDEFLKVKRSYRIALFDAEDEEVYSDTVESVCHAFRHLIPGASYRATITDSRVKDSTATQSVHVELQKLDTAEKKSESLLLANSTHIFFLDSVDDYLLGTDPVELPLRLPENEKIAAIAAAAVNQIFIGTSQGKIFRRELGSDDPLAEEIGAPSTDGAPIKQLAVDFMQEKVYALFNDQVIRCDFLTCANETASSIKGVAQLAIDSWNGYIYYLNTQGLLFAQPLFPLTDQLAQLGDTHTPEAIVLPSPAAAITVDYVVGQLVIILQNGSAYGYDLVDHSLKNMRESRLSKQSYADVVRLVAKNGRLFYSSKCTSHPSGVCLYGEEQKPDTNAKGEHLLNLNPYLYSGELVDLSWLGDFERPVTVPQPASVGLITSATSAKVTWENPKLYPFQAPSDTWRRLQYECDLTAEGAEETPEHFLNITGNEQLISAISFGVGYRANVRVCWRSVCSPYANSSSAAFAPYQENPVITYAKVNDKFEALGVLGEKLTSVSVKPEQLPTKADESVVFDSFTGNIYRSNGSESTVEWVNDSGEVIGRINSAGVRWLSLMPNRAILLAASRYSVVAYRLLGTIEQQFYTCESNVTECAQVVGMATDDASGEVFFLLEDSKGAIQLFTASQDVQQPYLVATVTNFPRITQLLVVKEKLMFVTEDGKVGFCDKALGNININYATTNIVQIALNLTYTANEQSFEFDGPIAMGSSQRHEVKWYVKPQFIRGKILYKITMHRGPSDPNPFVDAAISHQYFIPSELLDEWDSKQKFDVVIDAITPWARKSVNGTGLFAPSKPPTAPLHPKLFVTQQMTPDGQRAFVQFAWQEPKEWNGQPFGYSVKCMEDEVLSQLENVTRVKMYSFAVKPGAQVSCQVAATNEPFEFDTIGVYTTAVKADSNNLNPLIKLFAIDATDNLVEVENWLNATTKRRKRRQAPSVTQAVDFIDDKLFAIRKESASQQLFLLQMSTVDVDSLLLKVSIKGDVGQVLGMASDWLANRLLVVGNGNIYRIDLDGVKSASLVMPRKLLALSSSARDAKDLLFDPFTNTAYILTTSNALIAIDLHTSTEENLSVTIDCLKEKPLKAIAAEFIWNSPKSPFIYALSSTGLIHFDPTAKECTDVEVDWSQITGGIDAVSSLSLADKDLIFGMPTGVSLYNSTSQKSSDVPAKNAPFKSILAVSQASQPYPDRSCFELPPGGDIDFSVKNRGRSGAIVTVTPPTTAAACQDLSLPQTEYEVLFKRRDSEKTKHVTSFENTIQINEDVLDLDTDYEVAVTWRNRFSQPKDLSRTKPLTTGFGYPSAPKSAQAYSLSPDTILVFWSLPDQPNAPLDELRYRITVQSSTQAAAAAGGIAYADGKFAAASSPNVTCLVDKCQAKIPDLKRSTEYKIWITALHKDSVDLMNIDGRSNETSAKTLDVPGSLTAEKLSGAELMLKWTTLNKDNALKQINVEYKVSGVPDGTWQTAPNGTFDPKLQSEVEMKLSNLRSATTYDYRYNAIYENELKNDDTSYSISQVYNKAPLQMRTIAGIPSAPQNVRSYADAEGWLVKWQAPANDGGESILSFVIDYRPNASAEWQTVEESVPGSQLIWRPQNLHPDKDKSEFRVAAVNSIGVGAYGSSKDMPEIEGNGDGSNMGLVVAAAVLILLLVAALCVGAFIWHWRRNKKRMSKAQAVFTLTPIRPGIGGGNHNSPAHMPAELVEELKSLPHVPKSCVNLVRILGKGSFGEVFEGLACNLPRIGPKSLRVAVKTLKTGYSEDDRVKFLKEAILMNNFNHPNIVKLLGVCFDTEPHYLVLELMEGGDLLTFLRSSRPNDTMPSQLSLKDLVGMMVDVGRGGAYMEQRKHVHRDLAARNCLISTRDPQLRVTKIADFGLARDVYSNDYYRVNGQDFLPLRWMSPESTQDGVFSSKTDVWSFGILLWEIMTLGQLPYPGMHNMQVMSFVRNGGHPENPTHCPTEIFEIIEQTWITDVEKRPSFAALLVQLEALKLRPEFIDDSPFPPSPADHGSHTNSAFEHSESAGSNSDSVRISEPAAGGSARFERHGKDDNNRASKKQGRPSILRSLRKQKPKPVAPPSNAELRERLGSVGSSKHSSEKTGSASRPESAFSSGGESFTTLCDDYEVPLTKGMTNLARTERIGVRESPSSTPPTKRPIQLDQVVVTTPPPSTRANQRPSSVPEWGGDNPAYSPTDSQDYYEVPGRKAGSPPSTSADKSSKVQLAAGPNRQHADTSSESNIPPKELPMIRRPKGRAPPPPISQESGGGDEGSEDSTYAEISSPEPTDSNRDSQSTLIKPSPDSLGVDNAAFGERRSSRVSQV